MAHLARCPARCAPFCFVNAPSTSEDSNRRNFSVIAPVEECWHPEVYVAQVNTGLNPVSPVLSDSNRLPRRMMRSSGGGKRPVWHCYDVPSSLAASALHHTRYCHAVSVRTLSRFHPGGLPNGRPGRYVQYTSGALDHYSQNSAPTLDHMQRMRRTSSFPKQRQDQAQCQWSKARCMAHL